MKLIVGLGNPGREYVGSRHNVGYEVIDALAVKLRWVKSAEDFNRRAKVKFDALTMDGTHPSTGEKLLLAMPMTFMNASGQSVQAAASFYQVAPPDILIVLDDIALPCGRLRLRSAGSSGGHNGLKDIERALGTSEYPRLRIGIDAPSTAGAAHIPQRDYVLGKFSSEQRTALDPAIARACEAIETWIGNGIVAAMNRFNADTDSAE